MRSWRPLCWLPALTPMDDARLKNSPSKYCIQFPHTSINFPVKQHRSPSDRLLFAPPKPLVQSQTGPPPATPVAFHSQESAYHRIYPWRRFVTVHKPTSLAGFIKINLWSGVILRYFSSGGDPCQCFLFVFFGCFYTRVFISFVVKSFMIVYPREKAKGPWLRIQDGIKAYKWTNTIVQRQSDKYTRLIRSNQFEAIRITPGPKYI